jgi:hypothetical protein
MWSILKALTFGIIDYLTRVHDERSVDGGAGSCIYVKAYDMRVLMWIVCCIMVSRNEFTLLGKLPNEPHRANLDINYLWG